MPSNTDRYSVGQMTTRRLVIFDAQNAASFEPWSQQFHALNDRPSGPPFMECRAA